MTSSEVRLADGRALTGRILEARDGYRVVWVDGKEREVLEATCAQRAWWVHDKGAAREILSHLTDRLLKCGKRGETTRQVFFRFGAILWTTAPLPPGASPLKLGGAA